MDQRRDLELAVVPRQLKRGLKLPLFEVVVLRDGVPDGGDRRACRHGGLGGEEHVPWVVLVVAEHERVTPGHDDAIVVGDVVAHLGGGVEYHLGRRELVAIVRFRESDPL